MQGCAGINRDMYIYVCIYIRIHIYTHIVGVGRNMPGVQSLGFSEIRSPYGGGGVILIQEYSICGYVNCPLRLKRLRTY